MGRPKKTLTPEQVREVETLAAVLTQQQIADTFGMSSRTIRNRLHDDPDFAAAYARGRARAVHAIGVTLLKQAHEGNTQAAIFYLKSQGGWKETVAQEISGPDGQPLAVNVVRRVVHPDANGQS